MKSTTINSHITRRTLSSARPLRYSVLTVICGSVMILGFFLAARQHFSSIEFGIKNSRLRKQLDELEAEKRRLLLAKEVSMSPVELMKAARRIEFAQSNSPNVPATSQIVRASATVTANAPNVQKTVMSKPAVTVASNARAEKLDRQPKREVLVKDKKS